MQRVRAMESGYFPAIHVRLIYHQLGAGENAFTTFVYERHLFLENIPTIRVRL